jgi:hypothetical protein
MIDDKYLLDDLIGHDLSQYVFTECYYLLAHLFNGKIRIDSAGLMIKYNSLWLYCDHLNTMEFLARIIRIKSGSGSAYDICIQKKLVLLNKDTGFGYLLDRSSFRIKIYSCQEVLAAIETDENAFCWNSLNMFMELG